MNFDSGLQQIQAWDNSSSAEERQYAEILRKRYVDQLGYDEIGREMWLTREAVENTLERAKYRLRKLKTVGKV